MEVQLEDKFVEGIHLEPSKRTDEMIAACCAREVSRSC